MIDAYHTNKTNPDDLDESFKSDGFKKHHVATTTNITSKGATFALTEAETNPYLMNQPSVLKRISSKQFKPSKTPQPASLDEMQRKGQMNNIALKT